MNDLDLRLEVVSRSCQPLRYIRRWMSQKPLEIEAWFQRTTNRKWHKAWTIKWSRDRWRHVIPEGSTVGYLSDSLLLVYHRFCIVYCIASNHLWCSTACRIVDLYCKLSPTSMMHLILISSRLLSYVAVFRPTIVHDLGVCQCHWLVIMQ